MTDKKCDYPKCDKLIREQDKALKPHTAKLCEEHNKEMEDIINDIPKLTSFMMKVAFGN